MKALTGIEAKYLPRENEQLFGPALVPGEKLLWSGKPGGGIIFRRASLFLIILTSVLLGSGIGAALLLDNLKQTIPSIEIFRAGSITGIAILVLFGSLFSILSLIVLWGFVVNPIQRHNTRYALTDQRAITVSGLLKRKAISFNLRSVDFLSLTKQLKGRASIILGEVDPIAYGLLDPVRKQKIINGWKWFGYRFEVFEIGWPGETFQPSKRRLCRFEQIENARMVYGLLQEATAIKDRKRPDDIPEPAKFGRSDFLPEAIKGPGILAFVVDVSGSMNGIKIDQAKQGLLRALDCDDLNKQVGLLTFDSNIVTRIPVAPLAQNCSDLKNAIEVMGGNGATALYDAIKAGIEMTDSAPGPENAVRAIVVLTDGQACSGETHLDNIVRMTSRDGAAIEEFEGFEGDVNAQNEKGRWVCKQDIVGHGLAMRTCHPVQIFFIGIGGDADMEIGRILAQATGAGFQEVTENNLARVLEEFKYF
jgi:hypothetical protein